MADEEDKSELHRLFEKSLENDEVLTICVTVDTGLEWLAVDECREKLGSTIPFVRTRGKVYFNVSAEQIPKVLREMRSVDNVLIVASVHRFAFDSLDATTDLATIRDFARRDMNLAKSLNAWRTATRFPGDLYPTREAFEEANALRNRERAAVTVDEDVVARGARKRGVDSSRAPQGAILRYRVTCERTGRHAFESGQVARVVGGELQDKYNWLVDLRAYHLEIVCNVVQNELSTSLRVTHESKHRRNIEHFGPTTLRATVCYCLTRLASVKPGDVVVDPMCGGGSIPIEAAQAHPCSYVLCGDNHEKAVERTRLNVEAVGSEYKIDETRWSAARLPLRDSFVDVFVTDMPFGKRSGTVTDNRVLYKGVLLELARVARISTGRLVLLTYDRRSIGMALRMVGDLFRVTKMLGVNMGGLQAAVYVLKRSNVPYERHRSKPIKHFKTPPPANSQPTNK